MTRLLCALSSTVRYIAASESVMIAAATIDSINTDPESRVMSPP
jgi:hypothetical protein